MDTPADYRITVRGSIPDSWKERLGGMRIIAITSDKTTLVGRLPDQAALIGVIDALYGLNLPLLEVISYRQLAPI